MYLHHHNPLLIKYKLIKWSLNEWVENIQAADYNGTGTIHYNLVEGQACNHILKSLISPFKAFKWIIAGTQRPFFIAVSLLDMCISEVLQNELQSFLEENSSFNFSCRFLNCNHFFTIWIDLMYQIWKTSRNKLKKHSVSKITLNLHCLNKLFMWS